MAASPEENVRSPLAATVVVVSVVPGQRVEAGESVVIVESMKMEHEIRAAAAGRVRSVRVAAGDAVGEGESMLMIDIQALAHAQTSSAAGAAGAADASEHAGPGAHGDASQASAASSSSRAASTLRTAPAPLRADLRELQSRIASTADASRPEAIAKRHALGLRSARENIAALCDAGSFIEYGALAYAAQTARRSIDDLIRNTPADGMITGIGGINGEAFGAERSRAVVLAYDATVLAGTQGFRNHQKTDRMLGIAAAQGLPVVLFAEGGGGRPGDVDMPIVAGLHVPTFASFAALSGRVPLIGIAAGRCFAGNAALLGCCDTIIATRGSSIGLGGPAMVEGGGLGRFAPEQIGPSDVQAKSGVIDLLVEDEAEAVVAARRYLAIFQGDVAAGEAPDPIALREALPANRQRAYDTRSIVDGVFDVGSAIELRAGFGRAVVTTLARLEGRPLGVLASNPLHLGGAIDADAADKAARFMQLCDAHALPMVSFVDTPGFMVGPDSEAQAHVRHASRMFVVAAKRTVAMFVVVLRKGYGLGAMALAGGGLHAPSASVAWPSGEFGAMGLEGAVDLGYRKELDAAEAGRGDLRQRLIAEQYEKGKAIAAAASLEIDAVIDPAETRSWLIRAMRGVPRATAVRASGRFIDPW